MLRLDKFLADMGIGTRSEVKKLISSKKVTVNGTVVADSSFKLDENTDEVMYDGKIIAYVKFEYYVLNKPAGIISATKRELRDPDTPCVIDLITDRIHDDLFPVGRLDKDTEGLLLITNDGALSHELLSPSKHVDKRYYVKLDGVLTEEVASSIESGVDIGDDKPTLPCRIENIRTEGSASECEIIIHEGRFHQIKRMFEAHSLNVTYLKRLTMGKLTLGDIELGKYVKVTREDCIFID